MTTNVEKQKQHTEDMLKIFKEETPLYDDLINIRNSVFKSMEIHFLLNLTLLYRTEYCNFQNIP